MRFINVLLVVVIISKCTLAQEVKLRLPEIERQTELSVGLTYTGLGVAMLGGGMILAGQLNKEPTVKKRLTIIGSGVAGLGGAITVSAVIPIHLLRRRIKKNLSN